MIALIVLDVDGCLTDGSIIYDSQGVETKAFNVKDGLAITTWIRMGHKVAIITGRESEIVKKRAEELGIHYLRQGCKNKIAELQKILEMESLRPDQVAVIGDDLNDKEMLGLAGWSFAPHDASSHIALQVDEHLTTPGGRGAVREMIEKILQKEGRLDEFLALW